MEQKAMDVTSTDKSLSDFRDHDRGVGLRARLDRAIEGALEDRRIVGTVVLVARGGDIVYGRAAGFADREAGRSMQENCIFLLSSVAKPIVTAAALRLVENGRMSLAIRCAAGCPSSRRGSPTAAFQKSQSIIFLLTQPASPMSSWNHKTARTIGCGFRTDLIAPTWTLMRSSGELPPRRSATSRAPDGVIQWR